MKFRADDKISLIGRSGCGKSSLGKFIQKFFPRKFIIDSLDEYPSHETDIHNFEEFIAFMKIAPELKSFTRVIKFHAGETNRKMIFEHYMKGFYYLGNCLIVIEEAQDYCSPHDIGHWFKLCMTSGRHKNLSFIFTTQRPALINGTVLSQSTHIFAGNLLNKYDNATMAGLMDRDRKEFSKLKNFEFFWFCPQRDPHTVKFNSSKIILD